MRFTNPSPQEPRFPGIRRVRAASNLQRIGETDRAIALLTELAEERTERADVLLSLGDVLRSEERYEEAAEAYADAIQRLGGF